MQPEYEQLDDKEKVGAEQPEGVSPQEAARRRRNFRVIKGGGEGGDAGGLSNELNTRKPESKGVSPDLSIAGGTESSGGVGSSRFTGSNQPQSQGNPITNLLGSMLKRRLVLGFGMVGFGIGTAIIALLLFLPFELVHMAEVITNFFDKRMEHTMRTRIGTHWKAVVDESGKLTGFKRTGHPLTDVARNYNTKKMMKDLGWKGEYDPNRPGKLVGFTDEHGVKHNLTDADLADKRSLIREKLSFRYPELGFLRLSIRARAVDGHFGVKRKLLENQREKIADKQADIIKNLQDKVKARVAGTDGSAPNSASEERARRELDSTVRDSASDARGTSAKAALAVGPAGLIIRSCGMQAITHGVKTKARVIREAQTIRWAAALFATAHQMKRGDLHAAQVNALMKAISGFTKSAAWQRIVSLKKNKLSSKTTDKFSPDGGGSIVGVAAAVDSIPRIVPTCAVVNSPLVWGGIVASDAAIAVTSTTSFGLADVLLAAGTVVGRHALQAVIFSEAANLVIDIASNAAKGEVVNMVSPPEDKANAAIVGYDQYSNHQARSNGGEQLTGQQVASINSAIAMDEQANANQKGLAYKVFSTDYSPSLANQFLNRVPLSPDAALGGLNSFASTLLSPFSPSGRNFLAGVLVNPVPSAFADSNPENDPSGWGIAQHGITDELLQKYQDVQANEDWVINYLWNHKDGTGNPAHEMLYDGQRNPDGTFNEATDSKSEILDKNNDHDDEYHRFVQKCLIDYEHPETYLDDSDCKSHSEMFERFRIYRLDLQLGNYINSNNNNEDDQNPDGSGPTPTPTTAPGSTVDMATLYDDSSSVACAPNTKDLGVQDGYHNGTKVSIKVCAVSNISDVSGSSVSGSGGKLVVNSRVSGVIYTMADEAKKAGVTMTASSGFRSMAEQQTQWEAHGRDPNTAAPPGFSNHQMGVAIDFSIPQCPSKIGAQCSAPGNPIWDWLHNNAGKFGYQSHVLSEAWHWSPSGN